MSTKYCLDTSAILDGWVRYYPPDVFDTLWKKINAAVDNGDLKAPEEVFVELQKKSDDVAKWAKARKDDLFVPFDEEIQIEANRVLDAYPNLVDQRPSNSQADPFVIALAKIRNITVVTCEKNLGTEKKPRIPIVCKHFSVKCISLLEMFRAEGWTH